VYKKQKQYRMRSLILFLLATFIISCNKTHKDVFEKEKNLLELQIDLLKQLNESLTTTHSFLFEKALNLEELDRDTTILIYKTIADAKNGDFWAIEAEKRILNLTKEQVRSRNPMFFLYEFDWFLGDTLELFQHNNKCGEWGGDIERIRIIPKTGERSSRQLFGYYTKESFDCDCLVLDSKPIPSIYKSKEIEFTNQQVELLKEAIVSLLEYQLNNTSPFFMHSGIRNSVQVIGRDRSSRKIFIQDYPSFSWNRFHRLKNEILK